MNKSAETSWEKVSVSDLLSEIETGVSVNSENRTRGNREVGILKTSCISRGKFYPGEHKAVLAEEVERVKTPLKADSILMSRMNTPNLVGEVGYVKNSDPEIFLPDRLWMFRGKDGKADTLFLSHLFSSSAFKRRLADIATGTSGSMKNIPQKSFLQILVDIPPLPEQKKIAEVLSGIDSEISALTERISRTRLSKQALLRNMVPHPSCDREKGTMEGWIICRLEDVCSLITYGFTNPMPTTPSGVYMVTAKDVKDGRIDKETARFTSYEAYRNLLTDKSRPVKSDILVTKDGTLGRTAIVRDEVVCINQSVALLRPQKEEFAEYLHLLLSTPQYQQTMLDQAGGSAVKHIYITTLAKMEITLPSSADQRHKIVQTFSSFDDALNAQQRKLAALRNLRLGLASDLLSGRKRVSV